MTGPQFLTRVRIRNYKSIAACDVRLHQLTVLVGPNGSGKSNFLDALRFTTDALTTTLDHALRDRGGIKEVRRRSGGHPNHFAVRLDFNLPEGASGWYSYRVGAVADGGFRVTDEQCHVDSGTLGAAPLEYAIRQGHLISDLSGLPTVSSDRLFLVSASGHPAFRPVFDSLVGMGFYNLNPSAIRQLQQPDPGTLLRRDGSNLASVLAQLEQHHPDLLQRIVEYLRRVAPGVEGVERQEAGPMETVVFRQRVAGQSAPWRFFALNMSDGTLRALAVLVAMLQANGGRPTLVGIEEPEIALHPAAVGILVDALRDASRHTQVVITSHSPELLDREDIGYDELLAVVADQGVTAIGRVHDAARASLRDRLFTAGELLRADQLTPSERDRQVTDNDQLRMFEP